MAPTEVIDTADCSASSAATSREPSPMSMQRPAPAVLEPRSARKLSTRPSSHIGVRNVAPA